MNLMGSTTTPFLLLVLFLFLYPLFSGFIVRNANATRFAYSGFEASDGLVFLQSSAMDEGKLSLTENGLKSDHGRVLFPVPVDFIDSATKSGIATFSTSFIFSIQPGPEGLAEGMAFLVAPHAEPVANSGDDYLGLFNTSSAAGDPSLHTFAVELDTYQNPEFQDMDDNHVGVDINGIVSVSARPPVFLTSPAFVASSDGYSVNLKSGQANQIWIDYNGDAARLDVSISRKPGSKPPFPFFSNSSLGLSAVLQDGMYIGFSASTASLIDIKYFVYAWSFSNEGPSPSIFLPNSRKCKIWQILISVFASLGGIAFALLGFFLGWRFLKKKEEKENAIALNLPEDMDMKRSPRRFGPKELRRATNGFHDKNLLGRGGFGSVYRGVLPKGVAIAVKRISKESRQGMKEFVAEVSIIGKLRHRNLVPLLGWCSENGLALVYEYMPNGSLDTYLFEEEEEEEKKKTCPILTWTARCKILQGVGAALVYLHEEWEQKIIHRDVKASNVLLDGEFNARLGDFGLAQLHKHGVNISVMTNVVGTFGYLAPEYVLTRKVTEKVDVYSFGALTIEVITGKRIVSHNSGVSLADRLWFLHTSDRLLEAVDSSLLSCSDFDRNVAMETLRLGLLCLHPCAVHRPSMRHALQVLSGDAPPLTMPTSHPAPLVMSEIVTIVSPNLAQEDVS